MKEKTKEVYYCDFCNKKTFQKKAMERHEEECYSNPANKRDCYNCHFLEVVQTFYSKEEEVKLSKGFYCKKKQIELYPPKIGYLAKRKGFEIGDEKKPMPLQCEDYKVPEFDLPF